MAQVQNAFIDAAAKAGVAHIVKLSEIMPALDSPFRFARMHAEIERHLEASGVAFTHVRSHMRPGGLTETSGPRGAAGRCARRS